jgi:hypothetical protein
MSIDFGDGPPLKDTSPWLRDERERHLRILDAAERNSVIEGLPRFTQVMRARMLTRLAELAVPAQVPRRSDESADRNSA